MLCAFYVDFVVVVVVVVLLLRSIPRDTVEINRKPVEDQCSC